MMSRNAVNFILDLVSFLILLGLTFTGYIIKYVLPPGTGGTGRILHDGSGQGIYIEELWSMTRHEWGSIHFYMAIVFVGLMITHIILHWKWIKYYVKSVFKRQSFNS
ncbi:MAG: DUF4405 domain-containing protein [Sedimentisphaerales bacterium]|nr:DUF4405 domain-containing protein [Sedimentisphaerales bacterium]